MLESELGLLWLRSGRVAEAKTVVETGKVAVEELQSAETVVHSSYYRLASEYYKAVGPPDSFYRSALMFLAYTPLEGIPAEEQYALATDISLAALTGEGVFNFGEVVRLFFFRFVSRSHLFCFAVLCRCVGVCMSDRRKYRQTERRT